jgi:hypothetical protein
MTDKRMIEIGRVRNGKGLVELRGGERDGKEKQTGELKCCGHWKRTASWFLGQCMYVSTVLMKQT